MLWKEKRYISKANHNKKNPMGGFANFIISVIILCLLMLTFACGSGEVEKVRSQEAKTQEVRAYVPAHPSFVTRQELNLLLAKSLKNPMKPEGEIVSMVMPHHLVAGHLIVRAMDILAEQKPSLIILVGPNHPNTGAKIITGYAGWQTPDGIVSTEESAVSVLVDKGLAVRDEEIISTEHSVGALVPFIKHFLPEAKIVPIILHHDVSLQEIDTLLQALKPFLEKEAVLISSVDFSHYLTRSEAQAKDQQTIRVMKAFDYSTLFDLGNDHLDSPVSLAASFRLAEKRGINRFTILDHTNSGIILQNDMIETTSYFTLVFCGPTIDR